MVLPLVGAAAAAAARIAANKAIVAAAKKEAAKKAALKNSKIVTIQGKKYTVAEAKVLSEKLRAQQSVNPLKAKNQKILDELKKLPKNK
jgi:phosphoribosylaminoimidazole carboxylase (NCAIR synthetase)